MFEGTIGLGFYIARYHLYNHINWLFGHKFLSFLPLRTSSTFNFSVLIMQSILVVSWYMEFEGFFIFK